MSDKIECKSCKNDKKGSRKCGSCDSEYSNWATNRDTKFEDALIKQLTRIADAVEGMKRERFEETMTCGEVNADATEEALVKSCLTCADGGRLCKYAGAECGTRAERWTPKLDKTDK